MKSLPRTFLITLLGWCPLSVCADSRVVVVAKADENYTRRKFGDGKAATETYVYLQGRYFQGATVDKSLDRTTFRELVSYLTPRLKEHQFVPAQSIREADLLFLVHWGATNPRVGALEMMGKTTTWEAEPLDNHEFARGVWPDPPEASGDGAESSPSIDEEILGSLPDTEEAHRFENLERLGETLLNAGRERDLAQLLGYSDRLRELARRSFNSAEEQTLRFDLRNERYFVIVRAYDLRDSLVTQKPKLVWTVHMNVSGPGNNFRSAMGRMSLVGPQFFGTTTPKVETVRSRLRETKVEMGDLIILGEAK